MCCVTHSCLPRFHTVVALLGVLSVKSEEDLISLGNTDTPEKLTSPFKIGFCFCFFQKEERGIEEDFYLLKGKQKKKIFPHFKIRFGYKGTNSALW